MGRIIVSESVVRAACLLATASWVACDVARWVDDLGVQRVRVYELRK